MNNRGFTLVELLTVVAIIGILSAMTLVTFPAARTRAKDGVVMSSMGQLRVEAEIIYGENSASYVKVETDPTTEWIALVADIDSQVPVPATVESIATAYCVSVALNSGDIWCVDSTGSAGVTATDACDTAGADCATD